MSVVGAGNTGSLAGRVEQTVVKEVYAKGAVKGSYSVGGLIGELSQDSFIYSSYTSGFVEGKTFDVGGLAGSVSRSDVIGSYSTSAVSTYWYTAGGLIGNLYEGSVTASFATGTVAADKRVGGLIGSAGSGSVIEASFATGYLSSNDDGSVTKGGLLGANSGYVQSINSYWATDTTKSLYTSASTSAGLRSDSFSTFIPIWP